MIADALPPKPDGDFTRMGDLMSVFERWRDRSLALQNSPEHRREVVLSAWEQRRRFRSENLRKTVELPPDSLNPVWSLVPDAWRKRLGWYCYTLRQRVMGREGIFLASRFGVGKSNCLALVARAALKQGIGCMYVPSGGRLVYAMNCRRWEHCAPPEPYMDVPLLLLDDLDDLSEREAEGQQWGDIADILKARHSARLTTCIATNIGFAQLSEVPQLARCQDRWAQNLPWRLESSAGSQRQAGT